jgi:hypothetical protein
MDGIQPVWGQVPEMSAPEEYPLSISENLRGTGDVMRLKNFLFA